MQRFRRGEGTLCRVLAFLRSLGRPGGRSLGVPVFRLAGGVQAHIGTEGRYSVLELVAEVGRQEVHGVALLSGGEVGIAGVTGLD
ncbi:hypothetical protein [uncultured Parabacteroides sp.]|uniref:hypothetical protein n=1 Tax=uncultured Parabacteroides sp. TaxID=512312 RepID=UPI00272B4DF6|nr:hypothetical protein [uncultured Parabacteroides sp.]